MITVKSPDREKHKKNLARAVARFEAAVKYREKSKDTTAQVQYDSAKRELHETALMIDWLTETELTIAKR